MHRHVYYPGCMSLSKKRGRCVVGWMNMHSVYMYNTAVSCQPSFFGPVVVQSARSIMVVRSGFPNKWKRGQQYVPCDFLFIAPVVMHAFVKLPGSRRHCAPMNVSGRMQCYNNTRLADTSACYVAPAYEQERPFLAHVVVSSGRISSYIH